MSGAGRIQAVGIDLGTTNSALCWAERRAPVRVFDVPQLVAPAEMSCLPALPSFVYLPSEAERAGGAMRLPWNQAPDAIAGALARDHGALLPSRQISSAKSWLSNNRVDRRAGLLPWGSETERKLSPVQASARLLGHLRDAWNHQYATGGGPRLEHLPVVVTVPASFDEEARELTVEAARETGLEQLTLLEEPLAALYAWIAAHPRALSATFGRGATILVCDVGGGTTDFSLIRASAGGGAPEFERVAIGEHLLLGGDNLDLALAVSVERMFGAEAKLTLVQRQILRRKCAEAKEQLLSDPVLERLPITLLGAGRGIVGAGLTADLTREHVVRALTEGFLPLVAPDDIPARHRRAGLRELGLPYETEPAITRHLAAFLARAGRDDNRDLVKPDVILFNGGFFRPALARKRVLDALAHWFGSAPRVLENQHPEAAVAMGAAVYARLRQDPAGTGRLLIRAGSPRTYYIGLRADEPRVSAVALVPRDTQEGTSFAVDREFTVTTNRPAAFTLYSSTRRRDDVGAVVTLEPEEEGLQRHAPLVTVLRYGKRSRQVPLAVRLAGVLTETGTLELWCESLSTEHRWRLGFNLRATEVEALDQESDAAPSTAGHQVVVGGEAVDTATRVIRAVFGDHDDAPGPEALVGELEHVLGHGKPAWPLDTSRGLADVLLEVASGRSRSVGHEIRWLNLTGFCMRPGFGSALDAWRVTELRKIYAAGLSFPRDVQAQVEWLVMWQRVSGGLNPGQQRDLAQRVAGQLGIGQRKAPRLNPQIERESWRLLGGLERLDAAQRSRLGDELLDRIRRDSRTPAWFWTLGRFGARIPLYGPLNSVVAPVVAERWIDRLLGLKHLNAEAVAAVIQIGARTGDPARDLSEEAIASAMRRLTGVGVDHAALEPLRRPVPRDEREVSRTFGEALPEGLRLGRPA